MRATAELAERLNVRLHTHLAETEDENRYCLEIYGCRPLDYLEECGWLNERTWLAHGIHFNAERNRRAWPAPASPSRHCACSNQTLGVGHLPGLRDWRRPASPSGSASTARPPTILESDAGGARRVPAAARPLRRRQGQSRDALRWATEGSAACIGRAELGAIAVGMQADLALFTLDELRFSGARRSARGACVVRRPSRRPRDGRRAAGSWRMGKFPASTSPI